MMIETTVVVKTWGFDGELLSSRTEKHGATVQQVKWLLDLLVAAVNGTDTQAAGWDKSGMDVDVTYRPIIKRWYFTLSDDIGRQKVGAMIDGMHVLMCMLARLKESCDYSGQEDCDFPVAGLGSQGDYWIEYHPPGRWQIENVTIGFGSRIGDMLLDLQPSYVWDMVNAGIRHGRDSAN